MELSPTVAEWAAAYEQERGSKPAELVLQIAEHILKVGQRLTELGRKDARNGEKPYPAGVFLALVKKAFQIDDDEEHETLQAVADLWRSDYMDGYNNL